MQTLEFPNIPKRARCLSQAKMTFAALVLMPFGSSARLFARFETTGFLPIIELKNVKFQTDPSRADLYQ